MYHLSLEPNNGPSQLTKLCQILMEQIDNHNGQEHMIVIRQRQSEDALSSSFYDERRLVGIPHHDGRPSNSPQAATYSIPSTANHLNFRNSLRRGDLYGPPERNPLNSGLWISIELVVTVGQIIASIIILSLSKNEKPQAPLFAWVLGYATGCVATLPVLYWRYRNCLRDDEQHSSQLYLGSFQSNSPEPSSYTAISIGQMPDDEIDQSTETTPRTPEIRTLCTQLNALMDHFKMALDGFFAVWFVVGNVWIFGGHSSPSEAPNLYRLSLVFLTFSCIGYAMPFVICATICCCMPCIISILGIRDDRLEITGATSESINALPTYKFILQKNKCVNDHETSTVPCEGGVLAAGTKKGRVISGEDAVCCICLTEYADNDELRELPCFHVFHIGCIDKWLKMNALCPLCKSYIGQSSRP